MNIGSQLDDMHDDNYFEEEEDPEITEQTLRKAVSTLSIVHITRLGFPNFTKDPP